MKRSRPVCGFAWLATASILSACGSAEHLSDNSAVVARVNGIAITAAQVSQATPANRSTTSVEARKSASRVALDSLVLQELLAQKAKDENLNRDPDVMRAIESSKRAVLADEWIKRAIGNIPEPSTADINSYISNHPEQFAERRLYKFRVATVIASASEKVRVEQQVATSPSFDTTLEFLRDHQMNFQLSNSEKTSDQFPAEILKKIIALKDDGIAAFPSDRTIEIAQLVKTEPAPIFVKPEDPRVSQLLRSQDRNRRLQEALTILAKTAKVEYGAAFSKKPASTEIEKEVASGLR